MKTLFKTFAYAAIAALALSSCAKEKLQPADELTGKLVTVHFGTENTDPSTKATLTPDAGETAFQAAWENGDVLSVYYINDNVENGNYEEGTVPAIWDGSKFSAELPKYTGAWEYYAAYPVPDATDKHVDFGTNRTQEGNAYNSKYDIMVGKAVAQNAAAGKDDSGKDIVFEMDRQTAIAYFHFTSVIDEAITSATLTVGDGAAIASSSAHISNFVWDASEDLTSITITFPEKAPNAQDFQLWFNVLPTSYSSMTLTVETDTKTFTISKNSKGKYEAGKLYKVKKGGISWTEKGGSSETVYAYKKIYAQSELTDGSYLIVSDDYKFAVAGSKAATNMIKGGAGTSIDITNDIVNYSSDLALDAFEIKSTAEGYSIKGSTCGYIGYSSDANNGLQGSSTTVYNNSISIVDGVATITTNSSNTTYTLCCNPNNGTPLVKYYKNINDAYTPISLYKYQEVDPTQVPTLYNVIINSVVGGKLSATPASAEAGTEISLTATPDEGYEFNKDWSVIDSDNVEVTVADGKFTMPAKNVTVSGSFSKVDYTITKMDSEGGSFTVKNNGVEVTKAQIGETITLEATAADGYEFDSWTVTNESTSKTVYVSENSFTMPGAKVTVKANFLKSDVIPVYASLAELVAAGKPTTNGVLVTVTLTNEEITKFYTTKAGDRRGVYFTIGTQEIELFSDIACPTEWKEGGWVSGTLTKCKWMLYKTTWELCPTDWTELSYAAPCETPVITLEGAVATITCATEGATIRYTLDESEPTETSTKYTSSVTLKDGQTIKAKAFLEGHKSSAVVSKKYTGAEEKSETIVLSNGTYSGSGTSGIITWSGTSCSFVQTKENSSSSVSSSYVSAPRWYASHKVTFTANSGYTITKVVVKCTNASYATALKNSTYSTGASASVDGDTVTITTSGNFSITMGAQSRISTVTVYYVN